MTEIRSVSLTKEDVEFCLTQNLSLTGLLRQKIEEVRSQPRELGVPIEKKLSVLAEKYGLALRYIEQEGHFNDFLAKKADGKLNE